MRSREVVYTRCGRRRRGACFFRIFGTRKVYSILRCRLNLFLPLSKVKFVKPHRYGILIPRLNTLADWCICNNFSSFCVCNNNSLTGT